MLRRGFKSWCEKTSTNFRLQLSLSNKDPLSPFNLADKMHVNVIPLNEIVGLSDNSLSILTGHAYSLWSAITISKNNKHFIIYNHKHSFKRQSTDLMHELAHLIIGHDYNKTMFFDGTTILRGYDKIQEDEADWLAGTLLLPREVLLGIIKNNIDHSHVCNLFQVSPKLLSYRLNVTGVHYQTKKH